MKTRTRTSLIEWADRNAPLVFLGALVLVLSLTTRHFATADNLVTVARQHSIIIVLAVGQTIVMISGGIDLSVGSVLALAGVVAGILMRQHVPIPLCLLCGILTGCACGLINGFVTAMARVPAFIATLGMMGMAKGIALVLSGGVDIDLPPRLTSWFGSRETLLAVVLVVLMVVVALVGHLLLSRTSLGRRIYAMGGNREAARLSGIDIELNTIVVFTLNGLIAGLAGMMMLLYLPVATTTVGEGYELDSIAAAVIGGTSLFGGRGGIGGTVTGAFILAVLKNGCDLRDISEHWQRFVVGLMTVLAVFYDRLRRRDVR